MGFAKFPLNCAYLGIPCIGYNDVNTQKNLFPDLSVERGDIVSARKIAKRLQEDSNFYGASVEIAKMMYEEMYTEKIFLTKWRDIVENL